MSTPRSAIPFYRPLLTVLLLMPLLWLSSPNAYAHNLNSGYSYVRIHGNTVEYELILPHPVMLQYDTDGNRKISNEELQQQQDAIIAYIRDRLRLSSGDEQLELEPVLLESTIQQSTEDPIVRFIGNYAAQNEIDRLTIRYSLLFNDVDPGHQNYIQLFHHDVLAGHRVVERGNETFDYVPDSGPQFTPRLLMLYVLSGIRSSVRTPELLLLALCVAFTARSFRSGLENAGIGCAAFIVGVIAADRADLSFPIAGAFAAAGVALFAAWRAIRNGGTERWLMPALLVSGFIIGSSYVSSIMGIGVFTEYKTITILLFGVGMLSGFTGLLYLVDVMPRSWRNRLRYRYAAYALGTAGIVTAAARIIASI